jgi:hypothetical protein
MPTRRKAVIFGVGSHGRAAFRNLRASAGWDVVAFVDNDPAKQGTAFGGLPIHPPAMLRSMDFDRVVLAGRNTVEIRRQLQELADLPDEKIYAMKRAELQPSEDERRRRSESIDRMLRFVIDRFETAGVDYWIDDSALLALRRAQDLSDFLDVDISILAVDARPVAALLAAPPEGAHLSVNTQGITTAYWDAADIRSVVLSSDAVLEVEEPAIIDMHTLSPRGDRYYYPVGPYVLYMPDSHYAGHARMTYKDMSLRVPLCGDEHLALLYGAGWQTPADYWHADSYGNIIEKLS